MTGPIVPPNTTPIPPVVLSDAVTAIPAVSAPVGLHMIDYTLDLAGMTKPITIRLDYSPDAGGTWRTLTTVTVESLGTNKFTGLPNTGTTVSTSLAYDGDPPVPELTTASSLVRAFLTTAGFFTSTGGQVAMYPRPVAQAVGL